MKHILFTIALFAITACTSDDAFKKGKQQLEAQGYTDVAPTGHEFYCCGKDDTFSDGFIAVDRFGRKVRGCICSGWGKGITIRFE